MLKGVERRKVIYEKIKNSDKPIICKKLAEICGVSRQVIVQDVALLRAEGHDIISTNNGYLLNNALPCSIVIKVNHTIEQMEDELFTIVDLGGAVKDIIIDSPAYGTVKADMQISSRAKAKDFLNTLSNSNCNCIDTLSDGTHCHTIEADSQATLNIIQKKLEEKGYLLNIQ